MDLKPARHRRFASLIQRSKSSSSSITSLTSSSRTSELCSLCKTIKIDDLRSDNGFTHGWPNEIVKSAEAGCPFCSLLADNFDLGPETVPLRLLGIRRNLSLLEREAWVEEGDVEGVSVINGFDHGEVNPYGHKLAFWTTSDDLAATSIIRRPQIEDFASDECLRLIKDFLDACVFHHPGCNSPVISPLPSRVLDVGRRGAQQDPVLVAPPKNKKDSYVALSYCWGTTGEKYVLTKAKSELAKPTFETATLPRTLRDAITLTKRLGFRYIWIDALCIIQEGDGGEDFNQQASTMHEIYGNAALTIAAAASSSVHDGIFKQFTPVSTQKCKIPYQLPDGSVGSAHVEIEDAQKGRGRLDGPLNKRAWTFQERILSPRVVIFYEDQVTWDCASKLVDSNGPLNPLLALSQDTPGRYSDYVSSLKTNAESMHVLTPTAKYMAYWRNAVEFYSQRQLTNPVDRLRAISGLAQVIHSKSGDEYLGGIWRSDFYNQLCWRSRDPKKQRQDVYRAPTWSWASIDGRVSFSTNDKTIMTESENSELDFTTKITLIPSATNSFGDIATAELNIKGYLNQWHRDYEVLSAWETDSMANAPLAAGMFFDDYEERVSFFEDDYRDYYFLFLLPVLTKRAIPNALIVKKVPDSTKYTRVGFFQQRKKVNQHMFKSMDTFLENWAIGVYGFITIV